MITSRRSQAKRVDRNTHLFSYRECIRADMRLWINWREAQVSSISLNTVQFDYGGWFEEKHAATKHLSKITKKQIIGTTIQSHYCRWLPPSTPLSNVCTESQSKSIIRIRFSFTCHRCPLGNVFLSMICRRAHEKRMMRKSNRFNTRKWLQRCVADRKISREWQEWWTVISIVLLEYWGWLQANVPGWNLHRQWRAKRII